MTKSYEFHELARLPQSASMKRELVKYDNQTLEDVLEYLTQEDTKPTLRKWIRQELSARNRMKADSRYGREFAFTGWAAKWSIEWDEVRMKLRRSAK